jgi:hypothetical protein
VAAAAPLPTVAPGVCPSPCTPGGRPGSGSERCPVAGARVEHPECRAPWRCCCRAGTDAGSVLAPSGVTLTLDRAPAIMGDRSELRVYAAVVDAVSRSASKMDNHRQL